MTVVYENVGGVVVSVSDSPRWPITIEVGGEFAALLSADEAHILSQVLRLAAEKAGSQ